MARPVDVRGARAVEAAPRPAGAPVWAPAAGRRRVERAIGLALFVCAAVSVLTTLGIVAVLLYESVRFFAEVPVLEFLTGTRWTPLFEPRSFGVLPLVSGSLLVAVGAALVAAPLGLLAAVFLSEYAPARVRAALKPTLELLAGVPTVVYGYFALTFLTPALRRVGLEVDVFNAASASLAVGIMVLPIVASLSDDALRAVPRTLREAGYALGATRVDVTLRAVLPAALSGILASILLAFSRALGETMIVMTAAGATPRLTLDPREGVQTMTAYIAQVSLGETPAGTVEYQSLFAVGLLLFALTLAINLASEAVVRRFREAYE